ncbi:MAG: hypothetical protein C5B54_09230 [Acidobacteria bacterium]|nr:MAG: hypothetical protein C5B54_09230 [Acidobacteriota bacterium]
MKASPQTPADNPAAKGTLTGKVTISPVFPHERIGVSNEASAEVYTAHKVVAYKEDGKTVASESKLDGKGYFKLELSAGTYKIDVLPHDIGMGTFKKQPETVVIEAGKSKNLDIELDTGIR